MAEIFPLPPLGSRNAFALFQEFIEEMETQHCSGLKIEVNGKRYAFSITSIDEQKPRPIGFQQFPTSLVEVDEDNDDD